MCGLLTDADYLKFGHVRLGTVTQKRSDTENAISCQNLLNDDLEMELQPSHEGAMMRFAGDLKDHKSRLAEGHHASALTANVVQGADESWFDHTTNWDGDTQRPEYEIKVRRGALLIDLTLSWMREKNEKDPREMLTGLVGLILQRIPKVGKSDTGVIHKVTYTISGPGEARQIIYTDPSTNESRTLKSVKLPWHLTKPLVVPRAQRQTVLDLAGMRIPSFVVPAISCRISVDGKTVVEKRDAGFASCTDYYTPPK